MEFIVLERLETELRHLFQLERRIEKGSEKTRVKEKTCQLDEFC